MTCAVVVGVVASGVAIGFVGVVEWLGWWLLPAVVMTGVAGANPIELPSALGEIGWRVLTPAVGGLLVGWLLYRTRERRPLGLPDTILTAHAPTAVPVKSAAMTAIASMLALGSGASVGQYGPLVHLGATLGQLAHRLARASGAHGFSAVMGLGCGAAAAIATAFNAPLAGVVFAHEVILRHYSLRAFAPITVAAIVGHLFANDLFPRPPLFVIAQAAPVTAPEFALFALLGLAAALLAAGFAKSVLRMTAWASTLPLPSYYKPAIAGGLLGVMALWLPEILGSGEASMQQLMRGSDPPPTALLILLAAKLIATTLCLSFGFAGGIFSPALFIGLLFGALASHLAPDLVGAYFSAPTVYLVCGMVAVVSPIIGAPLTAILMVFELTRSYDLTIAAMASVVFANLLGYRLLGRSLFDRQLVVRGFDLRLGRDRIRLEQQTIAPLVHQNYVTVSPTATLQQARDRLLAAQQDYGYVVSARRQLRGVITLRAIAAAPTMTAACAAYTTPAPRTFAPDTNLWTAMHELPAATTIPVITTTPNPRLIGGVDATAIIARYQAILATIRAEEHEG